MATHARTATAVLALALCVAGAGACSDGGDEGAGVKEESARPAADPRPFPDPPKVDRRPAAEAADQPNIIFIYTDDQELETFDRRYMPHTMRLLGDQGTVFENFVVTTPLCCPSRVTALTGQYAHNHGVYVNREGYQHIRDKSNTLGVWMQRAGYRTAWVGKFLQGYNDRAFKTRRAPGFDEWAITLRPKYYEWRLFTDKEAIDGTNRPRDYYTDMITRRAVRLIEAQAERRRPLFMVLNQLAPHRGRGGTGRCADVVVPAPGDQGRFADVPLPKGPSFNRVDPDKTVFDANRLSPAEVAELRNQYRCRLESLLGADRSVKRVFDTVKRLGELDNTVFVYSSDNGISMGEHALAGKDIAYEEGLHVPLAIRVPEPILGGPAVPTVDRLTANIDLAPTLLELADAEPCWKPGVCRTIDGRSLLGLMRGDDSGWPEDRTLVIEGGQNGPCGFRGVRTIDEVLLQDIKPAKEGGCVLTGEPELYDLAEDPAQLHNIAADPDEEERLADLVQRMIDLRACAGVADGDEEGGSVPPPCE